MQAIDTNNISATQGGLPLALIIVVVMFSGVGVVSGLLVVAREQKRNARWDEILYIINHSTIRICVKYEMKLSGERV